MDAGSQVRNRDISDEDAASDPSTSEVRKRRPQGSSRGVANLTPEQLAKKRANDREAQRAIRERTKAQIETLERRIRELTSQQPYQELQQALRQKEAVEAENAEIKKTLSSILSIIQPVLGRSFSYSSSPQSYLPNRSDASPNVTTHSAGSESVPSPHPMGSNPWEFPKTPATTEERASSRNFAFNRQDLARSLELGPERLGFEFLLDGTQHMQRLPNLVIATQTNPSRMTKHDSHGTGYPRIRPGEAHSLQAAYSPFSAEMAAHNTPIRNSAPTCPLDSILLDFLHERQKQAAEGVATPKLVGPAYPSVTSLLNPEKSMYSHPLSKVFTDILATFPGLSTLPEQVATLYIMFLIMRWQISPTQENYDRLPDWVTPRPSQLLTPHPAWIDHVPWPQMRDKLVRDHQTHDYLLENFFIPFTTTLSLNWPYEETDTLLRVATDSDELTINPVFERHLRRLENWSLGPAFAQAFPGLAGTYRMKADGR